MPLVAQRFESQKQQEQYFRWVRTDILRHVPDDAKSVLSVGCGAGFTERELVLGGARVVGIERDPAAAAAAVENGLSVICNSVANANAQLSGMVFDCMIYGDVLEHLLEPGSVLKSHVQFLRPGGRIIISAPNFRHYKVFWHLFIKGVIPYADAGLFDRTHVCFTTRRLVEGWVRDAGLTIHAVEALIWRRRDQFFNQLSLHLFEEFLAMQNLVVGHRPLGDGFNGARAAQPS